MPSMCGARRCIEGACYAFANEVGCASNAYCDPARGCIPYNDDVCNTPCALGECGVGRWRCEGADMTCEPFLDRPFGTPCSGGTCDGVGRCAPCIDGSVCRVGCLSGISRCSATGLDCVLDGGTAMSGLACDEGLVCFDGAPCLGAGLCDARGRCVPPAASVIVTPLDRLTTSEDGLCDTVSIRLSSAPTSDVQIRYAALPAGVVSFSPSALRFDASTWNLPSDVTICGLNDGIADGDVRYTVDFTVTSSDARYEGLAVATLFGLNAHARPMGCDLPCDTGNPCERGILDCSAASPVCRRESLIAAGTTCRAAVGTCDVAEVCDGASALCPPDALATTSVVCRAAAGLCDAPELCDGASADCPADALQPSSFVCRAAASSCDVAERCTASSSACPMDAFAPTGAVCASGFCDGSGMCTSGCTPGASCNTGNPCELGQVSCGTGVPVCVPMGAGHAGTVCRAASGPCDTAEMCTGASTICPIDTFAAGTVCRPSLGACDPAETCNGTSAACPGDLGMGGVVCRTSTGACDVAEVCSGAPNCPADTFASAGTTCRASSGLCDAVEVCSGASAVCPADAFRPASALCRASISPCDAAEFCSGTSASCPADLVTPSGTVCRPAFRGCDAPEFCDGVLPSCPTDQPRPAGYVCLAGTPPCADPAICDGVLFNCPAQSISPDGSACPPCGLCQGGVCTQYDGMLDCNMDNVCEVNCNGGLGPCEFRAASCVSGCSVPILNRPLGWPCPPGFCDDSGHCI